MDIFRPDKFRFFSWYLLCFAVGQFFMVVPIGVILQSLSDGQINLVPLALTSLLITLVWAIGTLIVTMNHLADMQIVFLEDTIIGPSVWFSRRVHFPLSDLDKEKSRRQNFFQRILGYRFIQSKTDQKILFAERTFDKNQVAMILEALGCARSRIA